MRRAGRYYQTQRSRMMQRLSVALAMLGGVVSLTGCVSIPAESASEAVGTDELSAHVRFLAQPALKGRKPRTRGSSLARRYIASRFESLGLVPWGQAKGYALRFALGTNMIGVLPGADPNLAGEIVIVAAHYDHLGKTKEGLHLGACDNASGVAALLEIAEQLALRREHPRRSVCFAAFDCEEMFTLGAFAFACRDDFDESKIAGVVNIDMLGRSGFAVLHNDLFMTGTERFPELRRQIQAGVGEGLALLPIGTEIAGPRGDHVVFETLDRPVLFFSCGPHSDYHRPTDTPERLDYESIRKSVEVIATAVDALADSDQRYRRDLSQDGDVEELRAIRLCLSQIRAGYGAMGWTENQARLLDPVIAQVDRLLGSSSYTRQDRLHLLRTATLPLIPLAFWPDSLKKPSDPNQPVLSDSAIILQTLFTEHRATFIRAARDLLKILLSQRTNFLLGRTMNYTVIVTDVPDHLIFVEPIGSARYRLSYLFLTLYVGVRINNPSGQGVHNNCNLTPAEYTGTREELTDYALLLCRRNTRTGGDSVWSRVLRHVVNAPEPVSYQEVLQARLAQGNWPNEQAWILDCARREDSRFRHLALAVLPRVLGPEAEPVLLPILTDPNADNADRRAAILSLGADSTAAVLTAVAELLSDQTPIEIGRSDGDEMLARPDSPFEGYPLWSLMIKKYKGKTEKKTPRSLTISSLAQQRLRAATKQNLGTNTAAWHRWIEANWISQRR